MYRIADWLRETRLRQTHPETGEPWTQDYLLVQMQERIGWAPHRPNYSKYESGKSTPKRDTLKKFTDFWALYDEPPPNLQAEPEPEQPDLAAAILALTEELEAMRREREAWTRGVVAVLRAYSGGQVPAELLDALAPPPLEVAPQ